MALGLIGIVLGLVLLYWLTYKGHSVIYSAILCSLVVLLFNAFGYGFATVNVLEGILKDYMGGINQMMSEVFFLFLLGALLGQLYMESGAASSIAFGLIEKLGKNASGTGKKAIAIIAIILSGTIMGYGGIDAFALLFTMVPLALVIMETTNIPRRYTGAIVMASGSACISGVAAPQFMNLLPVGVLGGMAEQAHMPGLAVTPMSGIVAGVIGLVIILVGSVIFAVRGAAKAEANGEKFDWGTVRKPTYDRGNIPNIWLALLPLVAVFVLFAVFRLHYFFAIGSGVVLALVLFYKNFNVPQGQTRAAVITRFLGQGAATAVIGALTISSMVGFGTVVEKLPIFGEITKAIAGLPMPPILTFGLAVLIIVGITASAPAGVVIALSALAIPFFQAGINPAAMHRVGSLASAVFDTLPIGGPVMMMLGLAGLTHKEGYKPIFFVTVFLTGIATFVAVVLYLIWPNLI